MSPKRIDELPDVPAVAEAAAAAGVPGYAPPAIWYGIVAPKGTPKDIVAKVNARDGADAEEAGRAREAARRRCHCRRKTRAASPSAASIESDYARYGDLLKTLEHHRRLNDGT